METKILEKRILAELESLIAESCSQNETEKSYSELHKALLKNHYNAAEVDIDYHRRRIRMQVVTDDSKYQAGKVNLNIPVMYVNLFVRNMKDFLKTCLTTDSRSLSLYAQLLQRFRRPYMTEAVC